MPRVRTVENMTCVVGIRLLKDARLTEETSDITAVEAEVEIHRPRMTLTGMTPGLHAILKQIQSEAVAQPELLAQALRTDGLLGLGKLNKFLTKLEQFGYIQRQLVVNDIPAASIRPLSLLYRYEDLKVEPGSRHVLSRFAYLRNERDQIILECPLGHAEIACHSPAVMQVLFALAAPKTVGEIAEAQTAFSEEAVTLFLNFLANAKALATVSGELPELQNPEVHDAALAPWEFHDLLFHTRSRLGRHDRPYGGTYPFKDKLAPLPIVKKESSDQAIPLYRPDLERLKTQDVPFTEVLERRSSIRNHGDSPLTLEQLGEFLYRSARVKEVVEQGGVSFRPSPGGGALHELEIYPLVERCQGLDAGLYHYNPLRHELYRVAERNSYVELLIRMAAYTAKLESFPQVLLIISARFQRMQHKYQSMTYSVILKNVGALYQTMYLVGTAMGLATSALGGGHSDVFAQAAGLNYMEETSVGEFILGSIGTGPGIKSGQSIAQ